MAAQFDQFALDLDSPEFKRGVASGFWLLVDRRGMLVCLRVYAWDGDDYFLQLDCHSYGDDAILGRFVDPSTGECKESAWPQGQAKFDEWIKWQQANLFICWPGDRAGIGHHTDWRALEYWKKTPNQIVQYLEFIRGCLNVKAWGYAPRKSPKVA